jgi:hypothetical protein
MALGFLPLPLAGPQNTIVTPGVGSIILTGFAPKNILTAKPGFGSVVLTGYAPTIKTVVKPGFGSVVLNGFAPTISRIIRPGFGSIILTGFAPRISTVVKPGFGSVVLNGFAPVIAVSGASVTARPGFGSLILTGYAPTVARIVPVLPSGGGRPRHRDFEELRRQRELAAQAEKDAETRRRAGMLELVQLGAGEMVIPAEDEGAIVLLLLT